MLKRYIKVRGQYDGFHKYEDAPDQVAFLRNNHRHMFKWKATIEVFHDDRELEFFIVLQAINQKILPFVQIAAGGNLGSCEQQAERILEGLKELYGEDRHISVTVAEDGENSGIVTWTADKECGCKPSRTTRRWEDDGRYAPSERHGY